MNLSELEQIIKDYTENAGFTEYQLYIVRLACERVERVTQNECVAKVYGASKLKVKSND